MLKQIYKKLDNIEKKVNVLLKDKQSDEERLINRKLDRIDKDAKNGKRKTLNVESALGGYSKYLK